MINILNKNKVNLTGFTLTEVLITLGIIGVVAALTIPSLISHYKKVQTVTRLKKAYTTMAQAFTRAQVDYGDVGSWDSLNTASFSDDEDNLKIKEDVEKYILPYLTNVISAKYTSLAEMGYVKYTTVDGEGNSNLLDVNDKKYVIELSDSTTYWFTRNSGGEMLVYIDINGIKTKNIWGRDAFIFVVNNDNKFVPYGYEYSSATNLNGCKTDGRQCGTLIMQEGWEITDKYPIRL